MSSTRSSRRPTTSSRAPRSRRGGAPSRRPGVHRGVDGRFALEDLPALPGVVARLLELDAREPTYFDDVVAVAGEDPPLCARIIAAANTCASAPAVPIVALRPAVARLGVTQVSGIVTAATLTEMFDGRGTGRLWWHALAGAAVARSIAEQLGRPELAPATAYLAGLLRDLGRFIMLPQGAGEGFGGGVAAEREHFGYDHAQLGGEACRQWGFPGMLVDAVRHHHAPDLASPRWNSVAGWLVRVVHVADIFVTEHFFDDAFSGLAPAGKRRAVEATLGRPLGNLAAPAVKRLPALRTDVDGLAVAIDLPPRAPVPRAEEAPVRQASVRAPRPVGGGPSDPRHTATRAHAP
ncbi:MAG: HDOD domain-containing protein [Myxococcota bacterium]